MHAAARPDIPRTPRRRAAAMILALAAASGCRREPPASLVLGGGSLRSGPLWLANGDLVVWDDASGVAFGQVARPNGARELAYLAVIRSRGAGSALSSASSGENDGRRGSTRQTIAAGGQQIEIRHAIDLAEIAGELRVAETLEVGGVPRVVEAGRLFLIDLRATPLRCEQAQAVLPAPGELSTTASVEAFARRALEKLRDEVPAVRALLE